VAHAGDLWDEQPSDVSPEEAADCRYTEIYLRLPPDWPVWIPDDDPARTWPFVELANLARLPHVSESWLWWGHTISADPPEPIAPRVPLSAWILGSPRSLRPDAREIRFGPETIQLHAALPIYSRNWRSRKTWAPGRSSGSSPCAGHRSDRCEAAELRGPEEGKASGGPPLLV